MPKLTPIQVTIGTALYTLLFAGAGSGIVDRDSDNKCGGVERWEVKIASDTGAQNIRTKKITRTIKQFDTVNTERYDIRRKTPRQDIERQVYIVKNCFITHAILESDNDIHLVIEDGDSNTMVAEIPDPACSELINSEFYERIQEVRRIFLEHETMYKHYRWDVTGVLFIDKEHTNSPTGNLDNNIELHPVIGLKRRAKRINF